MLSSQSFALSLQPSARSAAPPLAVLASGKLTVFANGRSVRVGPVAVAGNAGEMAVSAFEWSASGRYLGWQQSNQRSGRGEAGWYDTVTHRSHSWRSDYEGVEGWSVTGSGLASLVPGEDLGSPATLTRYSLEGAVTHQTVRVKTTETVAGYSGGFIVGPDITSNTNLWRVSVSGAVTTLAALPKPSNDEELYEVTAASSDGKVFAAELGDHTDGCGVGPASSIFVINEATGAVRQAALPSGWRWREQSFVFDPHDALDATMVNCTSNAWMATAVVTVAPSGAVTAVKRGALVATTAANGAFAYQAGHAREAGTEAAFVEPVPSGPLTVDARAVPGVVGAATVAWAP
jgi:hypothetical protein